MSVQLVGVLNVTPDSFSDGGLYEDASVALLHAAKLIADGADFVDIGAESTNPKKTEAPLSSEAELTRLVPMLETLIPAHPGHISVDSYHPETIRTLAETFGTDFIVNDVTGMNNPAMRETVAKHGLTCIISHLPARFGTDIQAAHHDGSLSDAQVVKNELLNRRQQLIDLGLSTDKIILDPGIGFGKTMQLNWELLKFAELIPDIPVMIGYSRKRFLATDPHTGELLPNIDRFAPDANVRAGLIAIAAGARYLRVHDIATHRQLLAS